MFMFIGATAVRVPIRAVVVLPQTLDNGGRFLRLDDYGGAFCGVVNLYYSRIWLHAAVLGLVLCGRM